MEFHINSDAQSLPYEHLLYLLSNIFRNFPAPGYATTLDVIGHARRVAKIALRDRLTLGAAEFFGKPLRKFVPAVHTTVEFIDFFIEGISTNGHDGKQADDPHGAIFDLPFPQTDGHHAGGESAAGLTHEQRPPDEG